MRIGLYALFVLLSSIVRDLYFGALVPNTFASKTSSPHAVLSSLYLALLGINVNIAFPMSSVFVVLILLAGYVCIHRLNTDASAILASTSLTALLFSSYTLPDWTNMGRYIAPYLPAMIIMLWMGIVDGTSRYFTGSQRATSLRITSVLLALGIMSVEVVDTAAKLTPTKMEQYPGYVIAGKTSLHRRCGCVPICHPDPPSRRAGLVCWHITPTCTSSTINLD